jgi:hypothetical protein
VDAEMVERPARSALRLRTCSGVLRSAHSAPGAEGAAVYFDGVPQTKLRSSSAESDGAERYRTGPKADPNACVWIYGGH